MIKKIYLRSLVNLTEKFKLKFNEDKYFARFKALLEQSDKRSHTIAILKYFFSLFDESKKPIIMKVDISYLKDFQKVIEILKSENVSFFKINIQELQL